MLRVNITSLRPHTAMSERRTCATGICQRICKAHVFDETFGVNRAFNAEVFVAAPHAVAMEFDLFGERRNSHWVKGGGVSAREVLVGRDRELHDRRPDAVSCFLCIMPHMESTFSDLIGRDCLTPQGDRAQWNL